MSLQVQTEGNKAHVIVVTHTSQYTYTKGFAHMQIVLNRLWRTRYYRHTAVCAPSSPSDSPNAAEFSSLSSPSLLKCPWATHRQQKQLFLYELQEGPRATLSIPPYATRHFLLSLHRSVSRTETSRVQNHTHVLYSVRKQNSSQVVESCWKFYAITIYFILFFFWTKWVNASRVKQVPW